MALEADGLFSLKWGEFQPFISNSVRSLRVLGDFADVTLVCEDGQLEAHKFILSACSPFFQRVLKLRPLQQQLLIFMRGVKIWQLTSLLDFIYTGEVEVPREAVDEFILLAGELKIKGLVSDEVFDKQTDKSADAQNAPCKGRHVDKKATEDEPSKLKTKGLASGKPSKVLPSLENKVGIRYTLVEEEKTSLDKSMAGCQESDINVFEEKVKMEKLQNRKDLVGDDMGELEEKIESMMEKGEKGFVCKVCEKYAGTRQHVIYHIEANHLEGLKHLCTECHKSYKVRHSLQSHINRKHKKETTFAAEENMDSVVNAICV